MSEIKVLWQRLFGADAPTHNRRFLERRLAYRLQEVEFRQVDPNLLERNARRIAALLDAGKSKKRDRAYRPTAGTVLTREYQGIEYRVATTADGQYEFAGPEVPEPVDDRPRDHRHPVVRTPVLRAQGTSHAQDSDEEGSPAMSEVLKRRMRCAVYTRKSTDEGLDQEYNSIDAQRDAGHAYIASQRAEGWIPVADDYDDPAFSGGHMERPALKRLLADIEAGKIDIVVVYKIDRLTRSLADFSKMVEVFERYGVSFVSVTQQFNTTTSMGRLMLNILLSFAQFEREVTGERIRDKFAASKRKGMWMGGVPPLGYDVENRRLVPNEGEAQAGPPHLPALRRTRLQHQAGQGTEAGRRHLEGLDHPGRQGPRGQADRQGADLQTAPQPDLPRGAAAPGAVVPGRAPRHHRAGAVGPGPRDPGDQRPGAWQRHPGDGAVPAQGPGVRQRRARLVALAHHQEERAPLPLLRPAAGAKEHAGASGLPRLPAAELESAVLDQLRAHPALPGAAGRGAAAARSNSTRRWTRPRSRSP